MSYSDLIKKYQEDLGAKTPAPGGGSAAALSAATASNLVCMVCHYTMGKEEYGKYEARVNEIRKKLDAQRNRLLHLIDADVCAYKNKDKVRSVEVPAEVCELSFEVMKEAVIMLKVGNKRLLTDAALAVTLAAAGFIAALSYVEENLKHDRDLSKKYRKRTMRLKKLVKKVKEMRHSAEAALGASFGR